jgi:Domain of unknown function (DUF4157)
MMRDREKIRASPEADRAGSHLPARREVAKSAEMYRNPIAGLQQAAGNQRMLGLLASGAIQAKLRVSQPGEADEVEADRVAERVVSSAAPSTVHRKCNCEGGGASCPACEEEEVEQAKGIHRKAASSANGYHSVPDDFLQSIGPGQPLDSSTRASMESRFGRDFGDVRVHTGDRAAESARSIQARAYTRDSNVVFDSGAYAPGSAEGKKLLAHELTHVVQQRALAPAGRPLHAAAEDGREAETQPLAHGDEPNGDVRGPWPMMVAGTAKHGLVQRDPAPGVTKDVASHPDQYARWKRHVDTPYGQVWYWDVQEARLLPHVRAAITGNAETRQLYVSLLRQAKQLGIAEARVKKETTPTEAVVDVTNPAPPDPHGIYREEHHTATVRDASKQVTERATKHAAELGDTAEGQREHVDTLNLLLKDFSQRLRNARDEIQHTERLLDSAQKKERAAKLREEAERQEKLLDTAIGLISAGIEGIVALELEPEEPQKLLKPGWDAIAALVKLFNDNSLTKQASNLEEEARKIDLEEAAESCRRAVENLEQLSDDLHEAQNVQKDVESTYVRMRGRAEREYDQTARGSFRFSDVAQALDLATRTYDLANETFMAGRRAASAATDILIEFDDDPWNQLSPETTNRTARAMLNDAQKWSDQAISIRSQAAALRQTLGTLRATADKALANSPGTGMPR